MIVSKEGRIFVYPLLIATTIFVFTYLYYGISIYFPLGSGVIFFFCLNFFRDPKRLVPQGDNHIVSPADGKIIRIERIDDDEFGDSQLISIFLSIFNVHANRMPIDGSFLGVKYEEGKFLMAFDHRACDENERNSIKIMTRIAGLLARRIICYAKEGESMKIGSRLGFMRFGSRIDLVIPSTVKLNVELGQKVMGNRTIIGTF